MVQRYPSSGKLVEPERPPAPQAVLNAVKLMYLGAAVSTASLIASLADIGAIKPALRREFPHDTAAQIDQVSAAQTARQAGPVADIGSMTNVQAVFRAGLRAR